MVRSRCWQDTAAQSHLVPRLAEQGLERAYLQQIRGTSSQGITDSPHLLPLLLLSCPAAGEEGLEKEGDFVNAGTKQATKLLQAQPLPFHMAWCPVAVCADRREDLKSSVSSCNSGPEEEPWVHATCCVAASKHLVLVCASLYW